MELPAAKTVPPLLLLRALNGAPDLECLPLLLLSKRPGLAGGQSEAFRERFSLARLKKKSLNIPKPMLVTSYLLYIIMLLVSMSYCYVEADGR
jgi:hypothetical protein